MATTQLLDFLDGADLYPPSFDSAFSWPEDAPTGSAPATFGLSLVPAAPPAKVDPPAKTLRAHISDVEAIAQTIEDLDPEDLTDEAKVELSAMLIGAIAGTKKKTDASNAVLAMYEHLETSAMCERERLEQRAKYFRRQAQRLTDYLLATMEASGLPKLEGETSTLARKLNPPKVLIAEGAAFTHEFLRYPDAPPPEPDKDALKKALKAGRRIPGATLAQTARLVRS